METTLTVLLGFFFAEDCDEVKGAPRGFMGDRGVWFSADAVHYFNADRYDFAWNDDYTAFRACPLKWWDDASYIAYECDGVDPSYAYEAFAAWQDAAAVDAIDGYGWER